MENKIVLTKIIKENAKRLGFKDIWNEKVFEYYLDKNIMHLFGKNEFLPCEIEITSIIEDVLENNNFKKKSKRLSLVIQGISYNVACNLEGNVLRFERSNILEGFIIRSHLAKMDNNLKYKLNEEYITEYQNVCIENFPYFEYQKSIMKDEKECVSPAYRLTSLGSKIGNVEYFHFECLTYENKVSYLKKLQLIYKELERKENSFAGKVYYLFQKLQEERKNNKSTIGILTSYELDSCFLYLPEIFKVLEDKVQTMDLKLSIR